MSSDTPKAARSDLAQVDEEQILVLTMRELFVRTRESTLLGFLPVALLAWAHWDAQSTHRLQIWVGSMLLILGYRLSVAHLFLLRPQAQPARRRRWFLLEWLGAMALAAGWVSSVSLLGGGDTDTLFFLRLIFIVGATSFMLSAIGIDWRIYGSFLFVIVAGISVQLKLYFPLFLQQYPVVTVGLIAYTVILLTRSRGEYQRTRDWITARLSEGLLLTHLNQTIEQEREAQELLRINSAELEKINRYLAELAIRDGLTHAFSRGHIESELRRLLSGVQRRRAKFAILLIDLDWFKNVNDEHGHGVGDKVLRRVTALAQNLLRVGDLFGRWGGEEFIVLMPETALVQAVEVAERVRTACATMQFEDGKVRASVTVSIGAAQFQLNETADTLVARADKALYAAKSAGRNRVVANDTGRDQDLTVPA
jgi:diguanylate cyclase (GGDEF)-like protein